MLQQLSAVRLTLHLPGRCNTLILLRLYRYHHYHRNRRHRLLAALARRDMRQRALTSANVALSSAAPRATRARWTLSVRLAEAGRRPGAVLRPRPEFFSWKPGRRPGGGGALSNSCRALFDHFPPIPLETKDHFYTCTSKYDMRID